MNDLNFAVFGTGFWARFQLAAWREIEGAQCVALYNRTRSKAETLARDFAVPRVYDDAEELLRREKLDFVDIITDVETHRKFVELCAKYGVAVICQKPMAPNLEEARAMLQACRDARAPFFIHENWRWQTPLREAQRVLASGKIGGVFRARVQFCNSFPVFQNQPFLADLEQFILTDIGSHILDASRFLFGEATALSCQTQRVNPRIKGEDVATVMMQMQSGATVSCDMSYASKLEHDRFPETFLMVEGSRGSLELAPDFWLRVTDENGTLSRRVPPPRYDWADPAYDVVHSSIVGCNRDILGALRGEKVAETTGEDNFKTVQLVFAAYEAARTAAVVRV